MHISHMSYDSRIYFAMLESKRSWKYCDQLGTCMCMKEFLWADIGVRKVALTTVAVLISCF